MSGHPPFGAQVMLNGHEYVAVRRKKRIDSANRQLLYYDPNAADLAQVADTYVSERDCRALAPGL